MSYKAVIAGASGLIGSNLLEILLNEPAYTEVTILARKETGIIHKKLKEVITNFNTLDEYIDEINGHAVFCCLGTTSSKTPAIAIYRKIDHDYPVQLAEMALTNGIKQYHFVSSIGADENSKTFYTRLKGETENDIKAIGIKCTHIYQPSFLRGDRKEFRLTERIVSVLMYVIDPWLSGRLKKYRSIPAKAVAMAMYKQSLNNDAGIFIHPSDNIKEIA